MRLLSLIFCTRLAFAAAAPTAPALVYSTYLRDNFTPNAIATDAAGNIYMAGTILIDPAANQTTALVVKLNPQGTQYLYSRYLGGSIGDGASAIAVDSAGNAYVAGATDSPDFPVTAGGNSGGPPRAPGHVASGPTSFVTKLDPNGNVVFSDLLGGKSFSDAEAVAVTAAGQVIVSGLSWTSGFPTTPGAYSIADSGGHPFLLELDPTGAKLVFSATGIGGSAIALDSGGNIYVAGTTGGVVLGPNVIDYPTTPGAYQSTFPTGMTCLIPCQVADQYVTKVDPTGSKLIYSTSLSGPGNTYNAWRWPWTKPVTLMSPVFRAWDTLTRSPRHPSRPCRARVATTMLSFRSSPSSTPLDRICCSRCPSAARACRWIRRGPSMLEGASATHRVSEVVSPLPPASRRCPGCPQRVCRTTGSSRTRPTCPKPMRHPATSSERSLSEART